MTRTTDVKLTRILKNTLKNIAAPDSSQIYWLLRSSCVGQQDGGFILPTITLLLLMVSLIIGLLIARTYSRTTQVAGDRQQTVLYNTVTPAVDRAKAKLEYLFTEASLPPLPSDLDLDTELKQPRYNLPAQKNAGAETRMDINGDGKLDNAWFYTTDLDGDGETETVAYSILSNATYVDNNNTPTVSTDDVTYNLESTVNSDKAQALVVRNGPINLNASAANTCANAQTSPYAGWESVTSSELRKALQVHAVVLENTASDNPISATLEMQQDRVANLGNRWSAWWRDDMNGVPADKFYLNGAIHTEGSFFLTDSGGEIILFLVSSPKSCIYTASASEISMALISEADGDQQPFRGHFMVGNTNKDTSNAPDAGTDPTEPVFVDRFMPAPSGPEIPDNPDTPIVDRIRFTATGNTSPTQHGDSTTAIKPSDLRLNPIVLFTQGISQSLGSNINTFNSYQTTLWGEDNARTNANAIGSGDGGRIFNNTTPAPFLDDTYRADDRWGPKPRYTNALTLPDGSLGSTIPSGVDTLELLQNDPLASAQPDEEAFGYDGYWERRARRAGVRLIVGQRLELGNASEWLYEDLNGNGVLDTQLPSAADNPTGSHEDTDNDGVFDIDIDLSDDGIDNDTDGTIDEADEANGVDDDGDGEIDEDTVSEDADGDGKFDRNEDSNSNGLLDVDPLYPPAPHDANTSTTLDGSYADSNMKTRSHEMRQWKTLRDNLAAAQATAVYHYKSGTYDYPVACLATTAHPGTQTTDTNSRTFSLVDIGSGTTKIHTDFFTGNGTNGIEFPPPFAGQSNPASYFATQVDDSTSALRIALTNLAYFAGDPEGAFPPTQEASSNPIVHPYPELTMWGNFSELRRVITSLESGTDYADLSPADKSTLHTATCTLGMLAYSVDIQNKVDAVEGRTLGGSGSIDFTDPDVQAALDTALDEAINEEIDKIAQEITEEIETVTQDGQNTQPLTVHGSYLINGNYMNKACNQHDITASSDKYDIYGALDDLVNNARCEYMKPETWYTREVGGTWPYGNNYDGNNGFIDNHGAEYFADFTPAEWDAAYSAGLNGADLARYNFLKDTIAKASFSGIKNILETRNITAELDLPDVQTESPILRDRLYGFVNSDTIISDNPTPNPYPYTVEDDQLPDIDEILQGTTTLNEDWDGAYNYDNGTATATDPNGNQFKYKVGCDPYSITYGVSSQPSNPNASLGVLGLAHSLCSEFLTTQTEININVDVTATVTTKGKVRFPALFYLFPIAAHTHDGQFSASPSGVKAAFEAADSNYSADTVEAQLSTNNEYVTDTYIYQSGSTPTGVNATAVYRPVEDALGNKNGVVDGSEDISAFVTYLGMTPRDPSTATNWATPVVDSTSLDVCTTANLTASPQTACRSNQIFYNGTEYHPAFLDMGIYNGRELMSVRTLSIDLDLLRQTQLNNAGGCTYDDPESTTEYNADDNGKCWLPLPTLLEKNGGTTNTGAIIYAFREDAVREDAIARPTRPDASNLACGTGFTTWVTQFTNYVKRLQGGTGTTDINDTNGNKIMNEYDPVSHNQTGLDITDLLMDATGVTGGYYDPPVNPCSLISPKPVDFYADPDRRPHGFMLRNGRDLRRKAGAAYDTSPRGMSFISDQPVYIWGDFNYHSTDGSANNVEEFIEPLDQPNPDNLWTNFYSRKNTNANFADYGDVSKEVGVTGDTAESDNIVDTWRPVEIITDAVTILSNGFEPGFIEDGLLWSWEGGSTPNSYGGIRIMRTLEQPTSSQNNSEQADTSGTDQSSNGSNGPAKRVNPALWVREDNTITATLPGHSPIKLDRNGFPIYRHFENPVNSPVDLSVSNYTAADKNSDGDQNDVFDVAYGTNSNFAIAKTIEHFESPDFDGNGGSGGSENYEFSGRWRVRTGVDTIVNAVLVSGMNPFRSQHDNGGLPNFLRLIESWRTDATKAKDSTATNLRFGGSMIQLNSSSYTAPYTQVEREPGQHGGNKPSVAQYFWFPNRLWGYDPALLYTPAAPVARRFATPGRTRSEFYRELATDDPYILNLRCAYYDSDGNGTIQKGTDERVDPNINPASCPNN